MAAMFLDRNNKIFILYELASILCKLCEQISFVLSTNVVAMQSTYSYYISRNNYKI